MKHYIIWLLCLFFLCSCKEKEDSDEEEFIDSGSFLSEFFVQMYINPKDIQLRSYSNIIKINVLGDSIRPPWENNPSPIFEELSQKYNDYEYNKKLVPYSNIAVMEGLKIVDIVCDKEFGTIPPGTSFKRNVKLYGSTCLPFLQSGYKTTYDWRDFKGDFIFMQGTEYNLIDKYIDELTTEDMTLIYPLFYLILPEEVPESENYTFTVTFETADGVIHKNVSSKEESEEV